MKENIFLDKSSSGLYLVAENDLPAVSDTAKRTGLTVLKTNICKCLRADEALTELGHALALPNWYGANFDALHDCLTDPDWQPDQKILLIVLGLSALKSADFEAASTILDVFRSAAELRKEIAPPLWVLVDTPFSDLEPLPT